MSDLCGGYDIYQRVQDYAHPARLFWQDFFSDFVLDSMVRLTLSPEAANRCSICNLEYPPGESVCSDGIQMWCKYHVDPDTENQHASKFCSRRLEMNRQKIAIGEWLYLLETAESTEVWKSSKNDESLSLLS